MIKISFNRSAADPSAADTEFLKVSGISFVFFRSVRAFHLILFLILGMSFSVNGVLAVAVEGETFSGTSQPGAVGDTEGSAKPVGAEIQIARLKYSGGGDWYNDPTAIPNLARFMTSRVGIPVSEAEAVVTLKSDDIFSHPFVFVTGHDNIKFDDEELSRLRRYLAEGGFFYIDDDYGMDKHIRRELKRLYPDRNLLEIPFNHGVYSTLFDFTGGWPKIHEHYDGPPKCFGLFVHGRLAVLYTFNTNISDGWPEEEVHGDSREVREKALKAGANILVWALLN